VDSTIVRPCPIGKARRGGTEVKDIRVLVVDDQELFRLTMEAVVDATDGFIVVGSVSSGEESLFAAAARQPDLVLMDVNLPGIDGVEATRRLRATTPSPVVLLLSAYDESDVDALGCGAAAYITKSSFGPDRLVAAWAATTSEPGQSDPRATP
jgi:DNA-binding NarL/FixJ family response regulator